ncbi:MAG: efflux RND transporter permease subunit [Nitratireductor sp.]|nr:efflux RND transporter permease subunit [Nitratireductor sp.]
MASSGQTQGRAVPSAHDLEEKSAGLVGFVARHHNAANLIMILMILFGVFSLGRINTQFFPTLEIPNITVTVSWPGASAEDVEINVLQTIEPEVRFIDGVVKMESYSREGSGTVSLEFERNANMQRALSDVESAVKAITSLPEDSETPKVSRVAFFDRVANISLAGNVPEQTLRIYARKIRDDLIERGIDKVEFTGLRDLELQVDIMDRELRRLGLSIGEVSQAIAGNSRDLPSGQMEGVVEKQLRTLAEFKDPAALGRIEVKSLPSGEKVLLRDIADIGTGFEDGESQGLSNGKNAIELAIRRAPTADTLATAAILDEYLVELQTSLPPGIELQKYNVAANALTDRIWLLVKNGIGGLIIVVATLFIFLNARVAFWVAAGIPVAMLATIGLMMVMGQTINMISLFALIMMLGIIVDDAIVVGEHTATRFAMGDGPHEAAENGAGRMVIPVLAAMTTTIAAFAPILMVRDTIGQVMGVMPMVVIAVIIASLVECFFILPGHLAHTLQPRVRRGWSYWRHLFFSLTIGVFLIGVATRAASGDISLDGKSYSGLIGSLAAFHAENGTPLFLVLIVLGSLAAGALAEGMIWAISAFARRRSGQQAGRIDLEEENWFRRSFDKAFAAFRDGPFDRLVHLSFQWRYVTISVALGLTMIVFYGLYIGGGRLQFVFFPSPEAENINANLVFNAGTPEDRVKQVVNEIEASLRSTEQRLVGDGEKLVSAVFATLGSSGRNRGDNLATVSVQLTSSEQRTVRTPDIVKAWRSNLPKLADLKRVAVSTPRGGPPGRDIDIELTGPDAALLKTAAAEVITLVEAVPSVNGIADDLPFGKPELVMQLTPRGAALGFTVDEVGRQIRNAFEGSIARRFADGDDEIAIRVSRQTRDQGSAALRNFELKAPSGGFVPLVEVVSLTERQGFSAIRRLAGKTIVSVTADIDTDVISVSQALEQIREAGLERIAASHGIDYRFAGRELERQKSFEDLRYGVIIALSVIYIILAWVFASYFLPLAIMLIIPFGIVGAIFGHWLLGFNLTIMSFIALLGLAGILVNDSIILVSRMNERIRQEGEALFEAAAGASRDRLRAVLLTSLTTIGGLVPLMFEKSVQAQFILPMAVTIIFGLGTATLLVLFLVPAFVGIGDDIRRLLVTIFGSSARVRSQPAE